MNSTFEKIVTVAVNTGWSVISPSMPRFPEASLWAGSIADASMSFSRWLGLPCLYPYRAVWLWLSFRAARVRWSRRPFTERLTIGVGAGLVSGLAAGLEALLVDSRPTTQR